MNVRIGIANDTSNPNKTRIALVVTDFSDVDDDKTSAFLKSVVGKFMWFELKTETTNQGQPSSAPRFITLISD